MHADFKPSPFYEVLQNLLPLQDLPGIFPRSFFFPKSTLTILIQRAQRCLKTDTLSNQLSR